MLPILAFIGSGLFSKSRVFYLNDQLFPSNARKIALIGIHPASISLAIYKKISHNPNIHEEMKINSAKLN